MKQLTLYLFVGYPGAGKTTVAKIIERATGATHIWTDHERHDMFDYPTHSKKENDALYSALNDRTAALLKAGKSVLFDTNFNFRKDRDFLRAAATQNGARTLIVWLTTPIKVARERATHDTHRARNRYHETMSLETFKNLSDHLEKPGDDEDVVKIDGRHVDEAALLVQFSET